MTRRFGLLAAFAFSGLFWLVLLLSSCEQPSAGQATWRDKPPARYQGDVTAGVVFTSEGRVQRMCPQISYAVGCTVGGTIYVPNPCRWNDPYATLLCHEMGHVNGWPAGHTR